VFSASVRELWRLRYVRPDAGTRLDSRGWTFRRRLLEGLEHAVEVAGDSRPRSGGRGQGPPRRSPASAHPVLLHLPGKAGGRDARYRGPDIDSDTCPDRRPRWTPCLACWTARADTKTDGRRGRPHGRTRVPLVVCSRPSLRVGRGVRMTNDSSPPWAAVRDRVSEWVSSRPGRECPSRPPWCA
jgi:hypothetical protein